MSKKPVSPLRQRLIDDMTARRFSEDTKRNYVRNVRKFATFLGRSPDTATSEDLRRFQLHMAQQQVGPSTINAAITALRFFFTVTLEKPDLVRPLRIVNEPRKAPVVLSQEEVARLLQAAPGLKYKAALSVAYGAGLRVSEVANLKVSDIDSQRMALRVEQGKGQRDRYVMLARNCSNLCATGGGRRDRRSGSFPARTDQSCEVGVHRLAAGDDQHQAAKQQQRQEEVRARQEFQPVDRVEGGEDLRIGGDLRRAQRGDGDEPDEHDRAEHRADPRGALNWTANRATSSPSVIGMTAAEKLGAATPRPSTAESTLIAGVIIPSPIRRPAPAIRAHKSIRVRRFVRS